MLSLDAFGRPVPDLPIGVTDYATAVRVHGDQIVGEQAARSRVGRHVRRGGAGSLPKALRPHRV